MKHLVAALAGLVAFGLQAEPTDCDYRNPLVPIDRRVDDLIGRMTPDEKVAQLTCVLFSNFSGTTEARLAQLEPFAAKGVGMMAMPSGWAKSPRENAEIDNRIHALFRERSRLHIPAIIHEEGAHGYVGPGATSFPIPPALASTWNPALVREAFAIAGREAALCGTDMVFTPVLDLAREQRWGRTEETYGEDPYLVSQMGLACVTGYQGPSAPLLDDKHVAATLKHYTAHGSPESGINISPTKEDRHTIADIQQLPFKVCVQAGKAMTVMAAYSEIDGVPMHTNKYYLDDILRQQWGFNGVVVSDWYGIKVVLDIHHTVHNDAEAAIKALEAGVDVETPQQLTYPTLGKSLAEGKVSMEFVNRALRRLLTMKFEMGLFDGRQANPAEAERVVNDQDARNGARRVAEEAVILLKNEGALLPFDRTRIKTLALIGPHADSAELGGYAGSPKQKVTLAEGLRRKLGTSVKVVTAEGVRLIQAYKEGDMDEIKPEDAAENLKRIAQAVDVAKGADVVVLAIGQNHFMAREAWAPYHKGDNASLELRGQQLELARAILATGKPVVVAVFNGSPLALEELSRTAPALLECWYLGQEAGDAFANVLFGDINPSGHLAVTLARSVGQLPVFYNHKPSSRTRGYVLDDDRPLYPFGFGLSYTTFSYSNLRIDRATDATNSLGRVSVDVTNTGTRLGKEVVQLYVHQRVSALTRPVKELRDFTKIELQPNERQTVSFNLTPEKLAFHDAAMNFVVEPGEFEITVGSSSADGSTVLLVIDHPIQLPPQ